MLGVVVSLTLALTGTTAAEAVQAQRERQRAKAEMFASPRIAPVANPDRAEILPVEDLLDQLKPGETASDLGLAAHFRVIEKARPMDRITQQELRGILMDPSSYSDGVSGCTFQPFVAFRYWSGKLFVDVLVDRDCFQVAFAENGRELLGYYLMSERAQRALELVVARARLRQ